jgi:two-component system, OmpR family, alkaline phosphatase synthesis response regulator PhoP
VSEKILLIEDNLDLIEIMRVFLTYRGYRVLFAQNGSKAIETARSEFPDLVITDVMLEEMDGVQIALQLRKDPKTCHIPILALTAKTFSENECEILSKVFDDLLKKPANLHQFEAKIQKVLKEFRTKNEAVNYHPAQSH